MRRERAQIDSAGTTKSTAFWREMVRVAQLARCAKTLGSRLSSAANQLLRHLAQPARHNLVTGTLADLPRSRAALLAENAPADGLGTAVTVVPRQVGS